MPYLNDRSARLFYDDSCGPCRFLARATEGLSRHRIVAIPLDSSAASDELGALPAETRYGSAHLSVGGTLRTGEAVPTRLIGLTVGETWGRVVERVPWIDRSLRRIYLQFWNARRTHGCGAHSMS